MNRQVHPMTNFDFLLSDPGFTAFAEAAIAAEKILHMDPAAAVLHCRRAMELAVNWMYTVDQDLDRPCQDSLHRLMNTREFRQITGPDIWKRMDFIRTMGNDAAHSTKRITREAAMVCLENLHVFLDFVAYCYGCDYKQKDFDPSLPEQQTEELVSTSLDIDLDRLVAENAAMKEELTARREAHRQTYIPKPLELTEFKTRKTYIDAMLLAAGWTEGHDWFSQVKIPGASQKADYVLYDDDGHPLALLEASRTCEDAAKGREQARLYADLLEQIYGRRPVIFLSNGFDTRIDDHSSPERKVATVYSKKDLVRCLELRANRRVPDDATVSKKIAGRYYQQEAIGAVCRSFHQDNRRTALLSMAAGSGKTRVVIGLCDTLLRSGWIRNILFLADRQSLTTQAMRSFRRFLPNLSMTDLNNEEASPSAQCVFSTYQVMRDRIDTLQGPQGGPFTCGCFDLVICDEVHSSVYDRHQDLFTYFDASLVGLTAAPPSEIDKKIYAFFRLENGTPTYSYALSQAVKDGFLVGFRTVETRLKFLEEGIVYDELSEADKAAYEETFGRDGYIPDRIDPGAINTWLFNEDTIREALGVLMIHGIHVDHGKKLGKTILFAENSAHCEKILQIFGEEYPHLPGYATVIDDDAPHVQKAIDRFSDSQAFPQIAISAGALDIGIDIPEVVNLVFFRKVKSRAGFWQMLGRGARLCPGLLDGKDKDEFCVFDFCGNFQFFRANHGRPSPGKPSEHSIVFMLKARLIRKLQNVAFQTGALSQCRNAWIKDMVRQIRSLDRSSFAVRQHLRHVEDFSDPARYAVLSSEDIRQMEVQLAPLLPQDEDGAGALAFDILILRMELACLEDKEAPALQQRLLQTADTLSNMGTVPEVHAQGELIRRILTPGFLKQAGVPELEQIRQKLRELIRYIPAQYKRCDTDFDDQILEVSQKCQIL